MIDRLCQDVYQYVVKMRREIHAYPELSKQEEETTKRVCRELEQSKIQYTIVNKHNVVGRIGKGKSQRRIAVRADMDGLLITEHTGLPFASKKEGVMHACGHDAHTAMLLGAAKVLKHLEEDIQGQVFLCFQSAEEENDGAQQIVEYLKQEGGVDQAFGLHVWPNVPKGKAVIHEGASMAGCIGYHVDLEGEGGHGSRPDLVKDPVKAACDLVLKFSSIPGNFYDITDPCVVSTGYVKAGTLGNVFPSSAFIEGSCRYFRPGGEKKIVEIMGQMVEGVSKCYGVQGKLDIWPPYEPVVNEPECARQAKSLMKHIEGLEPLEDFPLIMGSENFSQFLKAFPGFFMLLGAGQGKDGKLHELHSDAFDFDESVMKTGCEFMVRYAYENTK